MSAHSRFLDRVPIANLFCRASAWCAVLVLACSSVARGQTITVTAQHSQTDVLLIGVSAVNASVVWISGAKGTVVRTTNGGATWTAMTVPGADSLQFRDIHAVDASTAYVLSAGIGPSSRIYKTSDGGATWALQYTHPGPGGFFDCMDFWDASHGIAFSDSYEGTFTIISTRDGGEHWQPVSSETLPPATEGEGGFAASGTCLRTIADSSVVIGTGAGARARLLRSDDRGASWKAFETPITGGTSASGISSVSFLDDMRGFAFGLDLSGDDDPIINVARTLDGGRTWKTVNSPAIPDVYGSAVVPLVDGTMLVVTGPKGIAYSPDGGEHWRSVSDLDHWGLAFADSVNGWATGPTGRITKLTISPMKK